MSQVATLAGRTLRRTARQPENLVATLGFPVLLMLILLAVFGDVVSTATGGAYVDRLVPLIVLEAAAFGAIAAGVGVRVDLDSGLVTRLRTMPVRPIALVTGRALADAARVLVATVAVVAVALVPGYRFSTGVLGVGGFLALAVVAGAGYTWLALAVGMLARRPEAVNGMLGPLFLLLLFFCSAFVPVDAFPDVVQPIVRANPFSCTTAALSGLAQGGPTLVPVLQTLAWTVAMVATFATIAARRWARATGR